VYKEKLGYLLSEVLDAGNKKARAAKNTKPTHLHRDGSDIDVQSIWSHAIGSQQMCGLCGCRLVAILARPQEFLQFLRKRRGYAARRRE
jgi:hypothetical protein